MRPRAHGAGAGDGDGRDGDVLHAAGPAVIGVLRDRRPRRRHLAAALVDLAARGHLVVEDAGNDPEIDEALDWHLLPGPSAPSGAVPTGGAGRDAGLAPHEQRLLDLVGPWAARPGQQRPPVPAWFLPGPSRAARGWLGVAALVAAASAPPTLGGGAGTAMGHGYLGSW